MAGQIYALQRDVDMLTQDMQELKRSYNTVDFIAHTVKNLWDEQVCQAAQMRRMEDRLAKVEDRLVKVEECLAKIIKHLGIK